VAPTVTASVVTPARCSASPSTGLALITPIDPVMVPGWATIASAAMAMK